MKRVILESPYAGAVARNVSYARAALRDSLLRGESPIASHLLYAQEGVLHDDDPAERAIGIEAGLAWGPWAEMTVVYIDFGISSGMAAGIAHAEAHGRPVVRRRLRPEAPGGAIGDLDARLPVGLGRLGVGVGRRVTVTVTMIDSGGVRC